MSPVPNMSQTLDSWLQNLTFSVVTKTLQYGELVETMSEVSFMGVWQPLGPEKIMIKPEGQRSWSWFQVHSKTDLKLNNDDVITYNNIQYRVDSNTNYLEYGYYEYHVVRDYTGAGPTIPVVP